MREIKFKGKRIDNGEWVYGNLIYDNISDKYWIDLSINESEKIDGGLHVYAVEVIPETVEEYTGLKDKNRKKYEIQEERIESRDNELRELYEVKNREEKKYNDLKNKYEKAISEILDLEYQLDKATTKMKEVQNEQ